ncbi:MAG TPA: glycosyltransferase family 2 protein [Thermoanaerobaculia bacterium]|nr:glycosyltransferase family 2 protein [Thermoanaerobaculia bacterium]
MIAIEAAFWLSLLLVAYVYAGYPLLLAVWSRWRPRPVERGGAEPTVSLVMAVRNERERLERKLENCLALDYPPEKLQIVVSLDGSCDGTAGVAARYAARGVEVVRSERHRGKAAALNSGVAAARGEIVLFCDARQRLDPGAVRELVACFTDPSVGAASGELVLLDDSGGVAAGGVGLYWRYEKVVRAMESRVHSAVGATGALYAIRRELWAPLPEDTLLDDVLVPMRIVLAGRRTVFEPAARAYDREAPPELEFARKVRTLAGNFQLLGLLPGLLSPRSNPVFVQFVSHKLGRLAVPHLLIVLLVSNLFLLEGVYLVFLAGQCAWYLLASAGAIAARGGERPAAEAPARILQRRQRPT